jgi:hypothetical protein
MIRAAHPTVTVYCVLSPVAMGCAGEGYILDRSLNHSSHVSHHNLIEGAYVAVQLHLRKIHRPVSVRLARVTWIQANRFGVEILLIDTDERRRVTQFLSEHLPLQVEFEDSRSELTITAAS